jgi:hypothetical protein
MGYITRFNLKWKSLNGFVPDYEIDDMIGNAIRDEQERNDEFMYAIDPSGECVDSVKWYNHEDELEAFSKRFPDVLFTLSGEGEESGDIWRKYFVNGKKQVAKAKITFDEFDPAQLR